VGQLHEIYDDDDDDDDDDVDVDNEKETKHKRLQNGKTSLYQRLNHRRIVQSMWKMSKQILLLSVCLSVTVLYENSHKTNDQRTNLALNDYIVRVSDF